MSYTDDPAFTEENDGPLVNCHNEQHGRDPSPEQIAERCAVIRQHAPRRPTGPRTGWTVAVYDLETLEAV